MMKLISMFMLSLFSLTALGQRPHAYSFVQTDGLMPTEPRPIVVFLKAPWCRYCMNMELHTFQDPSVRSLLDSAFYFVAFDGESRNTHTFRGHSFPYEMDGEDLGAHSLAIALAGEKGEVIYPSLVLLNTQYEIVFQHKGFLTARQMQEILDSTLLSP